MEIGGERGGKGKREGISRDGKRKQGSGRGRQDRERGGRAGVGYMSRGPLVPSYATSETTRF